MGHKLSLMKNSLQAECGLANMFNSWAFVFLSEIHGVVLIPIANGEAHCHRRVYKERTAIVGLISIPERNIGKHPRLHFLVVFVQGGDGDGVRRLSVGDDGVDVEHRRRTIIINDTGAVQRVRTAIRN